MAAKFTSESQKGKKKSKMWKIPKDLKVLQTLPFR